MKSFFAALRSLVLPFGATSGPRIVLDGVNGRILILSTSGASITQFADANFAEIDLQPPPSATPGVTFGPARIFAASSGDQPRLLLQGPPILTPVGVTQSFISLFSDNPTLTSGIILSGVNMQLGTISASSVTEILSPLTRVDGALRVDGTIQWGNPAAVSVEGKDVAVTNGTTASTTFTNNLTTTGIQGVSFVAPPSGKVKVSANAGGANATAALFTLLDFEIRTGSTVGSGSLIRGPDENTASQFQSAVAASFGTLSVSGRQVTGLTNGTTYNVAMMFRVTGGGAGGTFNRRSANVEPVI